MPSRIRTKGKLDTSRSVILKSQWTSCSQSSLTQVGTQVPYPTGTVWTMSDVVTPRFKARVRNGEFVMNPMAIREESLTSSSTGATRVGTGAGGTSINCPPLRYQVHVDEGPAMDVWVKATFGTYDGSISQRPPLARLIADQEMGHLVTEASTRVQAERGKSSLNSWENLAEINQSVRMIADAMSLIRNPDKLLARYRSKHLLLLKTGSKDSANAYLMWRYGISPIIRDVEQVIKNLEEKYGARLQSTRAKASIKRYSSETKSRTAANQTAVFLAQYIDTVEVRAVSIDEYTFDALSAFGFTPKALLTLPWELVNKSFVADWIVNVGDVLNAFTPAFGWLQKGACYTVERVQTTVITSVSHVGDTNFTVTAPFSGTVSYTVRTKQRTPNLARPGLVVKSDFKFDQTTRALDALAIFRQVAERFLRK